MQKSLIAGGLLGGLVLFAWGVVSWMVLPWHMMTMERFADELVVANVIQGHAPISGVYLMPNFHASQPMHADEHGHAAGEQDTKRLWYGRPFMFAAVSREGMASMQTALPIGFVTQIVAALIATWLLLQTRGLSFRGKVGFIVGLAVLASVVCEIPNWNWWNFPTAYILVNILDLLIGWTLAGLVLAKVTSLQSKRTA